MRVKSIRKSKLEIFYLMYQFFIVGLFAAEACAILYHYEASRTFDPGTVTKILNCASYLQAALSTVTFMYGIKKHLRSALYKWETYRHNYNGICDSVTQKYIRNFIITYTIIFAFCSLFIMSYYTLLQPVIITFIVDRFLTETRMDYVVWGVYSLSGVFEFWIFCSFIVFIALISGLIRMEFNNIHDLLKVRPEFYTQSLSQFWCEK